MLFLMLNNVFTMLASLVLCGQLRKLAKQSWQIGYFYFLTRLFYQLGLLRNGLMDVTGFSFSPFRENSQPLIPP
jgi:hypothetical protein